MAGKQIENTRLLIRLGVVVVVIIAVGFVSAGGIDFDLNEPPPPEESLEHEAVEEAKLLDPSGAQPLVCPTSWSDRDSASLRTKKQFASESVADRLQHVLATVRSQVITKDKELPDYCDYEKFIAAQHENEPETNAGRRNEGPSERMYRRSLYLKRCLDVFKSRVEYRLGKKSYLEGVTALADLSPNEMGRLFMAAPPKEFVNHESDQDYKDELREHRRALKENDLELKLDTEADDLMKSAQDATKVDLENADLLASDLSSKLAAGETVAKDASLVVDSGAVRATIATMLERSDGHEEYKLAMREELIGAELNHKSESCANFDEQGHVIEPFPTNRRPLSDKRPEGRVSGKLPAALAEAAYEAPALANWRRQYLDWSKHGCFAGNVYKQFDNCGCCYVVAAVNLAEFVACSARLPDATAAAAAAATPRRFSTMHALNCGLKYHPNNMGCSGGSVLETLRFLGRAGAYTRKGWRAHVAEAARTKEFVDSRDLNCPMRWPEQPWEQWGKVKIDLNPVLVHPNEWLEALEDGPLVATVRMPPDGIATYMGGVHDGRSCETSNNWHVMVLVGYGVDERGVAYWRFRNSFGPNWGDQGHFNLAMSVPGECFAGGVRVYREPVQL